MSDINGWIKIHRKILEWGWYGDPNTKAVFLHLLLTANFKDTTFRGITLKPGQTVVGRKALAETLGMSEQNVRTALNHLKSTNEITIKVTNKFSIVTLVNWESYQLCDEEVTNNLTNNQPTTNQQLTNNQPHLKKDKNVKKDKNIYSDVPEGIKDAFMEWVEMRKKLKKPLESKRAVTMALNKLNALAGNDEAKCELIDYAIFRGWLSFYPIPADEKLPKPKKQDPPPKPIDAVPMPEETKDRIQKLGFGNLIGKGENYGT